MPSKAVLVCLFFGLLSNEASAQVMKAGQWKMTLSGIRQAADPSNIAMKSELANIEAALAKASGGGKAKGSGEGTGSAPFSVSSTDCLPMALPLERIQIQAAESCRLTTVKTTTGIQVTSVCESSQRKAVYDLLHPAQQRSAEALSRRVWTENRFTLKVPFVMIGHRQFATSDASTVHVSKVVNWGAVILPTGP
jgi:hypothetical protein